LAEARVTPRGLAGDRRWALVDERGEALTQRQLPRLCLLRTSADERGIGLAYPGAGASALPWRLDDGPRVRARVFEFEGPAVEHEGASAWASRALGVRCRAVFMPDGVERPVDPAHARPGDVVSFADAFPALLASRSSLDDLNGRLPAPVTMARFRPNVVVEGAPAFAEDGWRRVRFGGVAWRNPKPCARCQVTTVDPATGETSPEPLRTLGRYRRRGNEVLFATNLIPDGEGVVRVGDAFEVLEAAPGL
jgi:hypothetical protein